MEKKGSSSIDTDGIWRRLAAVLSLENQDVDTYKWLKLVWKNDRRNVRTTFYVSKIFELKSSNNGDENKNIIQLKLDTNSIKSSSKGFSRESSLAPSSSSSTSPSPSPSKLQTRKCKTKSSSIVPQNMLLFALAYDEWKTFFDDRPTRCKLNADWTNKMYNYLRGINVTCTLRFNTIMSDYQNRENENYCFIALQTASIAIVLLCCPSELKMCQKKMTK